MAKVNIATMLQVGTVLHGTYRIESYLSSGGFGNTYVAKNIEFDETYAIKEFFVKGVCQRDGNSTTISVSNLENADSFAQQKEKFKKEARRLRKLTNLHIVKVYDLFEENGTAYYVMDYVDGENLSTKLNRTHSPLAESVVRNYLSQILDGLEAIHAAGIWHLDIKPANIMVDSHNVVKLIDFGASKQQSVAGGATMSTGISYTNGYAPSEQMAQSYDKFGPWTDFYALGATLYKLLTNQNPPSVTDLSEDESEDKHIALPMPNVSYEMKKLVVWMMQVNRLKRPKNVVEIRTFMSLLLSNFSCETSENTIVVASVDLGDNISKNNLNDYSELETKLESKLNIIERKCKKNAEKKGKKFSSFLLAFLGLLGMLYLIIDVGNYQDINWIGVIIAFLIGVPFFAMCGGLAFLPLVSYVVNFYICHQIYHQMKAIVKQNYPELSHTYRMIVLKANLVWSGRIMIFGFLLYPIAAYLCISNKAWGFFSWNDCDLEVMLWYCLIFASCITAGIAEIIFRMVCDRDTGIGVLF